MIPNVIKARAPYRGAISSLTNNNFSNQVFHDLMTLFQIVAQQKLEIDSNKTQLSSQQKELSSKIKAMESILDELSKKL